MSVCPFVRSSVSSSVRPFVRTWIGAGKSSLDGVTKGKWSQNGFENGSRGTKVSPHPDLSRSGAEKYNRFEIAFVTCDPDMISEALRATPAPRVQYIYYALFFGVRFSIQFDTTQP